MPQDKSEYLQAENTANDSPDTSQKLTRTSVQAFSGPLPPPSVLKGYEEVVRGSAERILVMAEKQQDHRTEQNRKKRFQMQYLSKAPVVNITHLLWLPSS
jgi:uncharacterized membrane protein